MSRAETSRDDFPELHITREVAEFVALDASLNPDHQFSTIWPSVREDPRFVNLIHSALEHGSKKYRGLDEEAVAGYTTFMEGISFALEAVRQAIKESEADANVYRQLSQPSEQ